MRLAWITDPHLDHLNAGALRRFCTELAVLPADALVITGDIAVGATLDIHLAELDSALPFPVYFVLGNHDFYGSSFGAVRCMVAAATRSARRLVWLATAGVVPLTPDTALVGIDSWYDGRLGDYLHSHVQDVMVDFEAIADLAVGDARDRLELLERLGDEAARSVRRLLPGALDRFEHVILATHVPPFREACWHDGAISDDNWLPFFTCKAVGDELLRILARYPGRRLTVLCGHSHGGGETRLLPNLLVKTGAAEYGRPRVSEILDLGVGERGDLR